MRKTTASSTWKIGQVAELAGVAVETIRFYERVGILPGPKRRASGYREFDVDAVQRIRFIRKMQDLGFSLQEVRELASAKGILSAIQQIDRRIQDLKELQRELRIQLPAQST